MPKYNYGLHFNNSYSNTRGFYPLANELFKLIMKRLNKNELTFADLKDTALHYNVMLNDDNQFAFCLYLVKNDAIFAQVMHVLNLNDSMVNGKLTAHSIKSISMSNTVNATDTNTDNNLIQAFCNKYYKTMDTHDIDAFCKIPNDEICEIILLRQMINILSKHPNTNNIHFQKLISKLLWEYSIRFNNWIKYLTKCHIRHDNKLPYDVKYLKQCGYTQIANFTYRKDVNGEQAPKIYTMTKPDDPYHRFVKVEYTKDKNGKKCKFITFTSDDKTDIADVLEQIGNM